MKNLKELEQKIQIEGLKIRTINVSEDIPAMLRIYHATSAADDIDKRETLDAITLHYQKLKNCNLQTDSLILEVNGEIICFGRTLWFEESEGILIYYSLASIHPDWRRKGIGTQVQLWLEKRAKEISEDHDSEKPKFLSLGAEETQKGKFALAKEFGFMKERFFYEMERDLSRPIDIPKLPVHLDVRPVKEDHYRKIWDASNEAFRDHWGYVETTPEDYENWLKKIETLPEYDPSLWKVAWDGEQVAGMVLNMVYAEENEILNFKKGWVDPICVRRQWRKQGVATALINESLQMFKEMGMDLGALGVDTNNPNGALGIYENCGFKKAHTFVLFRKPLN